MSKLIVGNFKMNMTLQDIAQYIRYINSINFNPNKNEVVICPSYIYIPYLNNNPKFKVGSQDVSINEKGAYTGEVSAMQLKELNTKYSILGHSDRRKCFGETENIINKKIKQCINNNIKPIVCIGESKEERLMMKTEQVLRRSILDLLRNFNKEELNDVIIAYEPIWAIGTGVLPTVKEIEEAANIIRNQVSVEFTSQAAKNLKLLYGGSVNTQNCKQFLGANGINGLLVGGASLKADEFAKICNS